MEQQPGPVNWAQWNPIPKQGMVRLWTWEALAHGAEVVSYFRWRQAQSAQEQMHAGLNLPGLHEWSQGGLEARQCGEEIAKLGVLPAMKQAQVAIVYDYEAQWMTHIQPQGKDFHYYEIVFRWYEAIRRGGLDVDFVRPGASLKGYKLVLVPTMPHVGDAAEKAFTASDAVILFGPRTGSKTRHFAIPDNLPPGPLAALLNMRVMEVSSMRPSLRVTVDGKVKGGAEKWMEIIETDAKVLARFASGSPALIAKDKRHYIACWPSEDLLFSVMKLLCNTANLKRTELPAHIRMRKRGNLNFVFNYGPAAYTLKGKKKYVLGGAKLSPYHVSAWQD
jgi:beta-galactosidase